jgi:iron-sulfur cluster assembly accessory protein
MITITSEAQKHFERLLTITPELIGILLSVKKFGCSGFKYELKVINQLDSVNVQRFQFGNIFVFVPNEDTELLKDVVVDMTSDKFKKKIIINNKAETGRCGCGESFSI